MTKLVEWLLAIGLFFGAYTAIITKQIQHNVLDEYMAEIRFLPLILLFLFGLYSASVVLYRTLTFNNCDEAAQELLKEIEAAKKDLKMKGFAFNYQKI